MIGRRIESRAGSYWGPGASLIVAIGLVAAAFATREVGLAVGGIFPASLAIVWACWAHSPPFSAEITPEGLKVGEPASWIPYDSFRGVWAGGWSELPSQFRKRSATIQVWHEGGLLVIPPRLDVPSSDVFRFLAARVPESGARDVDGVLAEYLERQESYFGPQHVSTYRAAKRPSWRSGNAWLRALSIALLATSIAWMILGFTRTVEEGWGWAGVTMIFFAILTFVGSTADGLRHGSRIKQRARASLVLGPHGMAMLQGPIQGEIRWPELLDVKYRGKPGLFGPGYTTYETTPSYGIRLVMKGAFVDIADIYDRPLYVIHDRILYLSGRANRPVDPTQG